MEGRAVIDQLPLRERLTAGGRAVVLGHGRSGRAALDRLRERGFHCAVVDAVRPSASDLGGVTWYGDDDATALEGVDLVVKSPGFPIEHSLVRQAREQGCPVIGELELGWAVAGAPLYSITGSNGKSTTTALLAHMLAVDGIDAAAAGNIGDPLSEVAPRVGADGAIAVEVSSFQIEDLTEYRGRGAALLNVTPDHLDRHGDLATYRAIKARLLDLVEPGGVRVLNADDPNLSELVSHHRTHHGDESLFFSMSPLRDRGAYREGERLVLNLERPVTFARVDELAVGGPHNVQNALAAAILAVTHGVAVESLATALRTFRALRHRMERVLQLGEVLFVNDSKATNLDSLRMALESFEAGEIVLIAGGRDKGSPFEDLAATVSARVRHLVLIGEAAPLIAAAWPDVPQTQAATMDEAVRVARSQAEPRGVVLLAPGCTSFDMFKSFSDRGQQFCAAVKKLGGEAG